MQRTVYTDGLDQYFIEQLFRLPGGEMRHLENIRVNALPFSVVNGNLINILSVFVHYS